LASFKIAKKYFNLATLFFIRTIYKNTSLIAQNLRTIPASAEEQILKYSAKVVNKTVASVTQFAKCILLHTYSCATAALSGCTRHKQKLHTAI